MLASVTTFAVRGIDSQPVTVEVDVRRGLPAFTIVGLPDRAVRESRERVRAALKNCSFDFPGEQRVTVNLAPADVRKAGPAFDLAVAVGILRATDQLPPHSTDGFSVCGELSLTRAVRRIRRGLAIALAAWQAGVHRLLLTPQCAR